MSQEKKGVRLAAEVGGRLQERGWMLATAESCTGGLIGHWITEVSGSSAYYAGGIISYADQAKIDLLHVPASDMASYGAVSAPVAAAMARGACDALGADIAVSVTGIAGPTGGTAEKPVGTVYLGLCSPLGEHTEQHVWPHGRRGNKAASALRALEMVLELLQARPGGP